MPCIHAASHHVQLSPNTKVYKDECTCCFATVFDEGGLDVCLTCFNASCPGTHTAQHSSKSGHTLFLRLHMSKVAKTPAAVRDGGGEPPQKMTKLVIEAEREEEIVDEERVHCTACACDVDPSEGMVGALVEFVRTAISQSKKEELKNWQDDETAPCPHVTGLVQTPGAAHLKGKGADTCGECDLASNLWLCLTCGHLGCGRKQFGGDGWIGGNAHGVAHWESSQHPVVCKLGTITPEGNADLYCYACDRPVLDEQLGAHLGHFGLDLATQTKTEKSTDEMMLDSNMGLLLSMTEDGKNVTLLYGPGYTGLANLGNSCYLASVMQVAMSMPAFAERYYADGKPAHIATCTRHPADCFHCQMEKLAVGMLSGEHSKPGASDHPNADAADSTADRVQDGIPPRLFKQLVCKDHVDFATPRQQDAMEFYRFFLDYVHKAERTAGPDPTADMTFDVEQRIQCTRCKHVRYTTERARDIAVPVPEPAGGFAKPEKREVDGKETVVLPKVAFADCLAAYSADAAVEDFRCPQCNDVTIVTNRQRFATFPATLAVQVKRFVYTDWVPTKLEVDVDVPHELDLGALRGAGLQDGESVLPEGAALPPRVEIDAEQLTQLLGMGFPQVRCERALVATKNGGAEAAMMWLLDHADDADIDTPIAADGGGAAAAAPAIDEAIVSALMGMGFSRNACERAAHTTGNANAEVATAWLLEHMGDADINDPLVLPAAAGGGAPAAAGGPPDELVAQLAAMGFTENQAKKALKETSMNMERAVDWLFSHSDDPCDDVDEPAAAAGGDAAPEPAGVAGAAGKYRLVGAITHVGGSVHMGHYVAHLFKDGQWVYFNDRKVSSSPNAQLGLAYIYFFRLEE